MTWWWCLVVCGAARSSWWSDREAAEKARWQGDDKWRELVLNYSRIQKEERSRGSKGKYVVAFADDYGLGNRINLVVSSLALGIATGRALVVVWPRKDCRRFGKKNCDPTSVDDLFAQAPVAWSTNRYTNKAVVKCRQDLKKHKLPEERWVMRDPNSKKLVERLADSDMSDWRRDQKVVCAYGYYYWGWGPLSCNRQTGDLRFPESPWHLYGALQNYLLKPAKAVRKRIEAALRDGETKCDLGLHLRKVDTNQRGSNEKWIRFVESRLLDRRKANADAVVDQRRVFVAADGQSAATFKAIKKLVAKRGHFLISIDQAVRSRDSRDGIFDALAENYLLSSCSEILPRASGSSTFHDIAVARAVWEKNWTHNETEQFFYRDPSKGPNRPVIAPPFCTSSR